MIFVQCNYCQNFFKGQSNQGGLDKMMFFSGMKFNEIKEADNIKAQGQQETNMLLVQL